jgi:hypothetical protein
MSRVSSRGRRETSLVLALTGLVTVVSVVIAPFITQVLTDLVIVIIVLALVRTS